MQNRAMRISQANIERIVSIIKKIKQAIKQVINK